MDESWAGIVCRWGVALNNGLDPIANATNIRVWEGKTLITDGLFAYRTWDV